jgi:signal transduction histidine kinase
MEKPMTRLIKPDLALLNPKSTSVLASTEEEIPATSVELQIILQRIVDDVVLNLECLGAMVAPLEINNSLPVRAYSVSMDSELLDKLEQRLGVSFIGPRSIAYLNDKKFEGNLGVQAIKKRTVLVSDRLSDLFRPVVPERLARLTQRITGIKQTAAVPLKIGDEVVGALFAISSVKFSPRDINFLIAFGNQAAAAIQTQRYLTEMQALERVTLAMQANITDETQILQLIVDTVVEKLGYVGAMVATLEANNSLPVRAYGVGFDTSLLRQLENRLGVSFIGPKSVAYLDDPRFQDNLSVRAVKGTDGQPEKLLVSDNLYDLFRPVINRPLSKLAQALTGITQVMAVPFFIGDEVVGNLFVASKKTTFSTREKQVLTSFAQQAAVGIRNARLYRKAEERRQIAQMFGKMAFSAAASIHALRNYVGATRTYLQLLELGSQLPLEKRLVLLRSVPTALSHLNESIYLLDNLHKPWRQVTDVPTDVNECLILAVRKAFPDINLDMDRADVDTGEGIVIHTALAGDLPLVKTSPDMLTEALRVVIKNGVEALRKHRGDNQLWVETRRQPDNVIVILIRDNGVGIKAEHLTKIFEMGWSTKKGQGMGFGLFWTKDYIEGLGGTITVESVWRKGTTFTIHLPTP